MVTEGSRPLPSPPVKETTCHDPRRLPPIRRCDSLAAAPRSSLSTRPSCPPRASRTIRLSAIRTTSRRTRFGFCNLDLRRAGTTVRAQDPLPRRCCRPVRASTVSPAWRATSSGINVRDMPRSTSPPFTRCSRFGIAPALAFAMSSRRTCQVRRVRGQAPCALRPSTEPTTSSRRAVLRRPDATSWRATWAEACEQLPVGSAKVPCAPTPQGSGTSGDPLLAERPRTPFVIDPGA